MSELDPEEEAVLETARRALTPPEQVTRRMRAALAAKLAAPGVIAASSAAAASATAGAAAGSGAGGAAASTVAAAATTAVAGAAASSSAVASGATIAASAAFLKAALGVATAAVLATATSPYWLPALNSSSVPSRSAAGPTPAVSAPGRVMAGRAAPVARTAAAPQPTPEPKPAQQRSTAEMSANDAPGQSREAPALKLQGELDGLRQAQQAIQGGQPERALELLAKLDAAYPASSLWQERQVARVLALCGVGRAAAAREIAQRVLAVSPNSLYASRIQSSCAGQPPQSKTPAPPSVEGPRKSTNGAPPVARFGDSGN